MSLRKILYGLEHIFEGLICDHVIVSIDGKKLSFYVRRWHPSHWIGYIRCIWVGDLCGSAFHKKDPK